MLITLSVGYCWVEVDGIIISPTVDCVSQLRVGCPPVPGSTTNDMCLQKWTFNTINVNQVTCTECVFRWIWKATHLSVTNPEPYVSQIRITLTERKTVGISRSVESKEEPISKQLTRLQNKLLKLTKLHQKQTKLHQKQAKLQLLHQLNTQLRTHKTQLKTHQFKIHQRLLQSHRTMRQ